ncbi:hypothetical protein [Promicromonospora iranensis]|uniref:N-acetyl-1-D-myo-inositol-2-amino-2-deoxy-alpha-D-glucopyranoside deacetylase n=1 Tax=Promicromonospora iranensis TaxID=1105144 RepID=A0ABU2CSC1_9MICO|nr:hypothetical protein [Promicromonospora iranensis]MDR7384235.1 hypothetical protein [Promicromonospora iranensis]
MRTVLAVLLGVVMGGLGTVVHRFGDESWYLGLVLALALTAAAGVLARAWAGYGTLLGFGVGWVAMVQALSLPGSGGDVVVPAGALGMVWSYAGVAVLAVVAFLPSSWFAEVPARRDRPAA